jgi:hypothetical protein
MGFRQNDKLALNNAFNHVKKIPSRELRNLTAEHSFGPQISKIPTPQVSKANSHLPKLILKKDNINFEINNQTSGDSSAEKFRLLR